ncbi:MAG: hypothetical protein RI935_757 [Candidatus Parcubacteria bacterium]|jgi:hypothetical protein
MQAISLLQPLINKLKVTAFVLVSVVIAFILNIMLLRLTDAVAFGRIVGVETAYADAGGGGDGCCGCGCDVNGDGSADEASQDIYFY